MSMTTIQDITVQLRAHAEGTSAANNATILADFTWMLKHGSVEVDTTAIWERILVEFERLNREVQRLERLSSGYCFPRQLVYAVNGMMCQCLNYIGCENGDPTGKAKLLELCWRIATTWDAIVAGDIEDLKKDVELESSSWWGWRGGTD